MNKDEFGSRLIAERDRLGWSQAEVLSVTGISRKTLFNYESGRSEPNAGFLSSLAEHGLDVLFVVTGQRTQPIVRKPRTDLLADVISAVESELTKRKLLLALNKKAELIALLYEHFDQEEKPVETPTVQRFLRLVA